MHVFSRVGLGEITGRVAILFLLHGRTENARIYDARAESIIRQVTNKGQSDIDLLVVTLVRVALHFLEQYSPLEQDQRNHGERLVDQVANISWKEGNDRHA